MTPADFVAALPAPARRHLDPLAPVAVRTMAAKGVLPLPPRELVVVLCGLTLDPEREVADTARASIAKLPDKLVSGAVDAGLAPPVLEVLAPLVASREPLLERIVLLKDTPDAAIAAVAGAASERVAEIIAANQERCLRSEAIVRALRDNAALLRSSRDRLFDFLVRAGVIYEDMPEYAEAVSRLSPAEVVDVAGKVPLPAQLQALTEDTPDDDARAAAAAEALDEPGAAPESKERVPVLKLVAGLNVSQKVALAIKGNKEARSILVRDMNRVVASAAIRNPRITEQEVVSAAQSRSVSDEVIRIIAASKELTRTYGVKVALVNNPKTPLPTAMRLLTLLRDADVRAVAKSKNVTTAVANQARRLVAAKTK